MINTRKKDEKTFLITSFINPSQRMCEVERVGAMKQKKRLYTLFTHFETLLDTAGTIFLLEFPKKINMTKKSQEKLI